MIDFATYFAVILTTLLSIWAFFITQLPRGDERSKKVKYLPVILVVISAIVPISVNEAAISTLNTLEKMEYAALNNRDFKENEFFFAFSEELDIIRGMNKGLGKTLATLKLAPSTWGWKPVLVDVQVSAIQAIQACYPRKWKGLKEDLFRIPLDKESLKDRLREEFESVSLGKNKVFCQFETLLKLI